MTNDFKVTVVIPTKNSEKTLRNCLESIKSQSYPNVETIIVDGTSSDNTLKIANEFSAIIIESNYERSQSKNLAIKKSQAKYICFIDSDMKLTKNVIFECVNSAKQDKSFGGIIIPEKSVGPGYWVKVRDFERNLYYETPIESPRFYDREKALQAGGFDENVVFYEESTLSNKLESMGLNVKTRIQSEILHDESHFNFFSWIKKKYYYGKTFERYVTDYPEYAKHQTSVNYRIKIFINNGKGKLVKNLHLTIGLFILKFFELIAIYFGKKS